MQETVFNEQVEGLVEEENEEEEAALDEEEEDGAVGAIVLADKKTEKKRKREKAEKIKVQAHFILQTHLKHFYCLNNHTHSWARLDWFTVSVELASRKCPPNVADNPTHCFSSPFPPQEQQRLADRRQTDQRQQLFQLRSIKASIKQQAQKTQAKQIKRKAKQEAQKAQPRRLGKLKYVLLQLFLWFRFALKNTQDSQTDS